MFAVLKTGGKQYKVAAGDVLKVEKIAGNAGEKVQFNDVLMLGGDKITLGDPIIADAGVQAEILEQGKGPKVINYVKRRRKHSSARKKGHRQQLTLVRIADILEKGADKSGVMAAVSGAGFVASEAAAPAKKAAPKKAAVKKAEEPKAAPKKTAPKKAKAAEGADDLTQISGVGPVIVKKLHDLGVTTFAQIAAWTPEDIAVMDEKLNFKGRIERDDWLKQAAELAKG